MKRISVLALISLCIGMSQANADYLTMGVGNLTCAQFAKFYQLSPKDAEEHCFAWAQGFMSGMNAQRLADQNTTQDLSSLPVENQEVFLRNYCDEHPLSFYWQAVTKLFLEKLTPSKHRRHQ